MIWAGTTGVKQVGDTSYLDLGQPSDASRAHIHQSLLEDHKDSED